MCIIYIYNYISLSLSLSPSPGTRFMAFWRPRTAQFPKFTLQEADPGASNLSWGALSQTTHICMETGGACFGRRTPMYRCPITTTGATWSQDPFFLCENMWMMVYPIQHWVDPYVYGAYRFMVPKAVMICHVFSPPSALSKSKYSYFSMSSACSCLFQWECQDPKMEVPRYLPYIRPM